MTRICEVCGGIEAKEGEIIDGVEAFFHLYLCEPCITDLRWEE